MMDESAFGYRFWAIAGGRIPPVSSGPEPKYTSRDELAVLNAGPLDARVTLTIYYADREPMPGYQFQVAARRVRRIRFNDLIDPEAMPLGVEFGAIVASDVPIVVQMQRIDTSRGTLAITSIPGLPIDRGISL